jgi:hypothetical protein
MEPTSLKSEESLGLPKPTSLQRLESNPSVHGAGEIRWDWPPRNPH